jgi:hypothetical protein
MEHVNDDMDELFRQAGELYPLKTSESDWDGMLSKLRDEISGEKGIPYAVPVRDNSNRRRWLLLILVPAFILSLVYFSGSKVRENNTLGLNKGNNLPANKNSPVASTNSSAPGQTENKTGTGSKSQPNTSKDVVVTTPVSATEIRSVEQASGKPASNRSSENDLHSKAVVPGQPSHADALFESASIQNKNPSDPESIHDPVEKTLSLSLSGSKESPWVYGTPFPPLASNHVTLNSESAKMAAKTNTNKAGSQKGIYAVVVGGPDWSSVSLQATEQAGYSLGILLGYHFNKRISIETGLLWDKKNYYSRGEYFDKSKTTIPNNVDIQNVDGYCNMFEIPLNLRYDIATRINHNFFASVGLSSYIMKKEYYSYTADVYYAGIPPQTKTFGKPYYNSSNYFLSVFQLSAGYEYAIGTNTKIRIEPYMKIPFQGIGIGSMHISSAGLYFGVSYSFH